MKPNIFLLLYLLLISACQAQSTEDRTDQLVGGPCEGCEAIFEYGDRFLSAIDTLPGFAQYDPKLKISGTVFEKDGTTPVQGVILYIYHTNREGLYKSATDAAGWARRHGQHRGWAKTDDDGHYTFYTFRPAAYPAGTECEHIHITVKEPDKNEYYIDEFVFDDDPLLTAAKRHKLDNRSGSGITTPEWNDGTYLIKRDIVLGLNIPNY